VHVADDRDGPLKRRRAVDEDVGPALDGPLVGADRADRAQVAADRRNRVARVGADLVAARGGRARQQRAVAPVPSAS
jgi:hypothetical protein